MKRTPDVSQPALVAFGVVLVLSLVIGERWPFSRFAMYAHLATGGAVLVVTAEGQKVRAEELVSIHGCKPEQVRLQVPSTMGWRADEIRRWIADNGSDEPGSVPVRFGYSVIVTTPDGPRLSPDMVVLCEATAEWGT